MTTTEPRFPWDRLRRRPPTEAPPMPRPAKPTPRPKAIETDGTAWPYHKLIVWGPAAVIADLQAAVRGSGFTPWHLDASEVEETAFHIAMTDPAETRSLGVAECRDLALHLARRAGAHRSRAERASIGAAGCALDINRLSPVPAEVLSLGRGHPRAVAWKVAHWGMADEPTRVTAIVDPKPPTRIKDGWAVTGWRWYGDATGPPRVLAAMVARWPGVEGRSG